MKVEIISEGAPSVTLDEKASSQLREIAQMEKVSLQTALRRCMDDGFRRWERQAEEKTARKGQ